MLLRYPGHVFYHCLDYPIFSHFPDRLLRLWRALFFIFVRGKQKRGIGKNYFAETDKKKA